MTKLTFFSPLPKKQISSVSRHTRTSISTATTSLDDDYADDDLTLSRDSRASVFSAGDFSIHLRNSRSDHTPATTRPTTATSCGTTTAASTVCSNSLVTD